MKIPEFSFSNFAVYWVVLIGFVVLLASGFLRFIIPALFPNRVNRKRIMRFFPLGEMLIWGFYVVWSIKFFLKTNQYVAFIELIVFLLAGSLLLWFVLRDYFAGLLFRMETNFQIGDTIQLKNYSGVIVQLGNRKILLETSDGKKVLIPYASVSKEIIVKDDNAEMISSHQFRILVEDDLDMQTKIGKIRKHVLELPWSSLKKKPAIRAIEKLDESVVLELTIYPIDKKYFYLIEQQIRNKFEKGIENRKSV